MTPAPVGLRCPDHSGKPQGIRKVTTPAQRAVTGVGSRRTNVVTLTLVAINVGVYLAELAAGGSVNGVGNYFFNHGALFASGVYAQGSVATLPAHATAPGFHLVGLAHGEWWRMLSPAFLHYGPFHLAINMYSLYFAGSLLEQVIGRWRFALLYFGSGIAGSAGAIWLSPNNVTVGASGAIFGVLGGLFVLERQRHIATGGQVAGLIVLNLVFTFLVPGISVGGHVGGLFAGAVLMWLLLRFRQSAVYSILSTVGVLVVSFGVAYARVRGYN
jgi:membrane associated rhomboid family serine protease